MNDELKCEIENCGEDAMYEGWMRSPLGDLLIKVLVCEQHSKHCYGQEKDVDPMPSSRRKSA